MSYFSEDLLMCVIAKEFDLQVERRKHIEVTDPKALAAAGLMRECPDYRRIRSLLDSGKEVLGVQAGDVEFILTRRKAA